LGESVAAFVTSTPPMMERESVRRAASTSMPISEKTSRARSALRTAATTVLFDVDEDSRRDLTICLPTFPEAPKMATASLQGGGGGGAEDAEKEEEEEEGPPAGLDFFSPARAEATIAPRPTRIGDLKKKGAKVRG